MSDERGRQAAASSELAAPKDPFTRQGLVQESLSFWQRLAQCSPYIAEFCGCLMQALAWNCTELGKATTNGEAWKPLVCGLTLMVSTYSFATVSGSHLNPAVSIAVGLSNHGDWTKIAKYMVCQLFGSLSGVALSCLTYRQTAATAIGPRKDFEAGQCFLVEFFYTGMLCLVFLHVTLSRHNNPVKGGNQFFALAIGFVMAAGCWAGEDISGAIFNPAVSIGVGLQNFKSGVGYGFEYTGAQVLASFFASVLYRVMRPEEDAASYDLFVDHWSDMSKKKAITTASLFAEGVGSWFTVFTFGMTTLSKTYSMERPFAAGAALMSMHYALSDVSGGYFNPAVTLSVLLNGRNMISIKQALAYITVQIVFGSAAAFVYTAIYPTSFGAISVEALHKYGASRISGVEAVYSFVICYVALSTITVVGIESKVEANYYSGLAYGLASAAGGFAMLHLANSLANPALTLGVALAHTTDGGTFYNSLWASAVQFVGAVLASCVFRVTHASDYRRRHEDERRRGESASLVVEKAAGGLAREGPAARGAARGAPEPSRGAARGAVEALRGAEAGVGGAPRR